MTTTVRLVKDIRTEAMRIAHENACTQCGECCRVKIDHRNELFILPAYCPALDVKTKKCTIYPDRHRILFRALGETCNTHAEAMMSFGYPGHCVYHPDPSRAFDFIARHHSELPRRVYWKAIVANRIKRVWLKLWLIVTDKGLTSWHRERLSTKKRLPLAS